MPTLPTLSRGKTATSATLDPQAAAAKAVKPPPKMRRRPLLTLFSIALVLLGGLGFAWAYRTAGHGQDILALRKDITRGQAITREDLITVRVGIDPALHPVPADQIATVVGKRAAMDMAAGGVVTSTALTSTLTPAAGSSIIGLRLTSGTVPSTTPLRAGDPVRLVVIPATGPAAQEDLTKTTPTTLVATIVASHTTTRSGETAVDVAVPATDAPRWAALSAAGQIALVLESQEH